MKLKKLLSVLIIASMLVPVNLMAQAIIYGRGTIIAANDLSIPGLTVTGLTASKPVFTDASKNLVSTGTLGVDQGGTGASNAADAFTALKQSATESATGVAELATVTEAVTGTDTSRITTPAGVAAAQAVVSNPKAMSQGVHLTASSTVGSLTVADNDNIDFGTGNFTLVWKGALPDWTPSDIAGAQILMAKHQGSADRWLLYINRTAYNYNIQFDARKTGGTSIVAMSTKGAIPATDGAIANVAAVITRETVDTAGSVAFYVNGVLWDTVTIPAGTPADISNTGSVTVAGNPATGARYASTIQSVLTFNRALSAAEVLSLHQNGIAEADKWGSQTALTSGTLTVGKKYRINVYNADDDFTNIGGTNVAGTEFTATGTTPTHWAHSSSLVQIGATLALESEGIQRDAWKDSSTNGLNASYPASGYSFLRPIKTDMADGLLSVTNVSLGADADTTLYTVPAGKRLVITKAILVVGADAGTSVISIGADGAETDWIPNNTLSALDNANDAAILQPVPNTTPVLVKSYAGGTVIQAKVSSHAGGATNSLSLFGYLY